MTAHQNGQPSFFPLSEKVKHIDLGVNFNEQYRHSFFVRGFIYLKLLHIYKKKLSNVLNELKADFTLTTISRDIDFLHSIKDGSIKIAEAHISKKYLRNLHLMQKGNFLYRIAAKIWVYRLEKAVKKFNAFVVLTQKDADNWKMIRSCTIIPDSLAFFPNKVSDCKKKQILSVGRLYEQKGYDMLIEAWFLVVKKNPDWKLYIYGSGELQEYLIGLIIKKGLSDSLFIKEPVKNIVDKYIESSLYVMSSRFEGFGMVLIEAMACGLPVISFDCPDGPSDIIANNEDGILVENGNIQQLAEKMSYMIEHEEIRVQMGQKARENVRRYNQDLIMKKWIDLFKSLKE
ncbi:MAG: glycosyltransferase family 4 protein [Bacteroidales bacterium]|nr:glycosyltransferase family 4 protein [Bacteroidales bacterium]